MSCRSTSGGAVSVALARSATGLPEKKIQELFHSLKREGAGLNPPSELEFTAWRERQTQLIEMMRRMPANRKDGLRAKLFRARSEPIPDGSMFYAWSRIEARARQEKVISEAEGSIDLAPPGSQADQYDLGEDGRPRKIWYASYGSNLNEQRFLTYIEGGKPPGSTRTYDGCDDKALPEEDIAIRFNGRPHFALTSSVWRGGIAFMDDQSEEGSGLGRAYLISVDQFDQVVAQENGGSSKGAEPVPLEQTLSKGREVTGDGPYETMVHVGDYQGAPVITFSAPFTSQEAMTNSGSVIRNKVRLPVRSNKPSAAYVRMIGAGLNETFGLDEVQQADYIRGCPGGDRWDRQDLVKALRGDDVAPLPEPPKGNPTKGAKKQPSLSSAQQGELSLAFQAPKISSAYAGYTRPASERSSSGRSGSLSNGAQAAASAPKLRALRPDGESYYPAVRDYPTVDDQRIGVRTWRGAVENDTALVREYAQKLESAEAAGVSPGIVAQWQLEHSQAQRQLAESSAKLEMARTQAPKVFYPPAVSKSVAEWTRLADAVRQQGQQASGTLDGARRRFERVKKDGASADKIRDAQRDLRRAERSYDEAVSRLDEIEQKRENITPRRSVKKGGGATPQRGKSSRKK